MKKRKKLKIFLIIMGVIIALIAGVTIWQWNNIKAVMYFLMYSEEDLSRMNEENKKVLAEALARIDAEVPRELTEEESAALEEGLITQDDAVEISLGITTLEEKTGGVTNNTANAQNQNPSSNNTSGTKTDTQKSSHLSNLIAQLYVLKSSYISRLDGLEAQGKAEYANTPSQQRTSSWKTAMINKYYSKIASWEAECDTKVEAVISQIKDELSKTGGDMSIIQTIRSTYDHEKQIKKAQYMNTYLK